MSLIKKGLLIGNHRDSQDLTFLNRQGVSHILCSAGELAPAFPGKFSYKHVGADDVPNYNMSRHFDHAADYVHNAIQNGGTVFIHCAAGISRSVTLALAYLMKHEGMKLSEAFALVKGRRFIANPNHGFMRQLREFETKLEASRIRKNNEVHHHFSSISPSKNIEKKIESPGNTTRLAESMHQSFMKTSDDFMNFRPRATVGSATYHDSSTVPYNRTNTYTTVGYNSSIGNSSSLASPGYLKHLSQSTNDFHIGTPSTNIAPRQTTTYTRDPIRPAFSIEEPTARISAATYSDAKYRQADSIGLTGHSELYNKFMRQNPSLLRTMDAKSNSNTTYARGSVDRSARTPYISPNFPLPTSTYQTSLRPSTSTANYISSTQAPVVSRASYADLSALSPSKAVSKGIYPTSPVRSSSLHPLHSSSNIRPMSSYLY